MRTRLTSLSLLPLTLLAGMTIIASSAPGGNPPGDDGAGTLLDPIWKRVAPSLPTAPPPFLWQRHLTPPLPLTWPPDARTVWVRHAYAYGFDARSAADGIRVSTPYARLRLDRAGRPLAAEATPPPNGRLELGIQGIFPTNPPSGAIDPEEIARYEKTALDLVRLPAVGSKEEAALASFYGRWLEREGVIANAVRGEHAEFIQWVEELRAKPVPPQAPPAN
ncbi:MAG: hypothetical protein ABI689_10710 [Thermoanaerobaculia bacterium]